MTGRVAVGDPQLVQPESFAAAGGTAATARASAVATTRAPSDGSAVSTASTSPTTIAEAAGVPRTWATGAGAAAHRDLGAGSSQTAALALAGGGLLLTVTVWAILRPRRASPRHLKD